VGRRGRATRRERGGARGRPGPAAGAPGGRDAHATARALALGLAVTAGVALGLLLWHKLFRGQAQSYDTLIYARSLWGVAHGHFYNPVLERHAFAVHANVLAVPLALFARAMPAALVLVLAQATAFGATVWLVARGFQDAARDAGRSPAAVNGAGLFGALVCVAGTPLVLNPFLFDARPDFLGLPFLVAGLLRAVRRGGFDRRAVLLMLPAALAREELALVIASALVLAPGGEGALGRGRRWLIAAGAVAYFVAYYFGVRLLLGGQAGSGAQFFVGAEVTAPGREVLRAKLELATVAALSCGALVWPGWRWLGAAVPGLVILAASRWIVEGQLSFHYGLLAAPGLLAAGVAGFRVALAWPAPRLRAWLTVAAVVAVGCYLGEGAAPGGRRFAAPYFALAGDPHSLAAHQRLAALPASHGLAVPWAIGAPVADRAMVMPLEHLRWDLQRGALREVPAAITTVAVTPEDFGAMGRTLVAQHGFRLVGVEGGLIEIVTRDAALARIPWDRLAQTPPPSCAAPLRQWPAAGLVLCSVATPPGQPATAVIARTAAAAPGARASLPMLLPRPPAETPPAPLWLADGMVSLADLPVGRAAALSASVPWTGSAPDVDLVELSAPASAPPR
jgi:uncharacterized membrane protein